MSLVFKPALIFAVIILIIVFALFYSPLFKAQKIDISQNQDCLKAQDVFDALKNSKNLFFISKGKLENTLKSQYSCIGNIEVGKKFPSKLEIKITVKEPVVKIEGTNFMLTDDGQVTEGISQKDNPIIFLPPEVKVVLGQKISDPTAIFAIQTTSKLLKSDFLPVNVRIVGNDEVVIYNQQGQLAIFSSKKDKEVQVDSLQQVISKAKIESAKIAKIDLRFDKPVISYRQ
ncbi:MAG: hypothetical protein UT12_C0022G0003 [Candidatus Curtissbacteria bacterium GW2011_GWC2_38_9]|uniref:POTRA domain-containing protein n=2 Tax=Candidatus Curtissiibacteriota TaxID=1752717 RepID=A0A1F5HQK6_9BACT|nr:MAG: hypothetical protein UT12_C0022G0003 [Candidatus Curtissbacteria bacterium GW2011_GWC2_38_9]OGD89758.1 MAG: hypothetical protein A2Z54_02100 [Candidatus Curtissbacteria bacterium RIFCSPHIGHO2_02_39_8]OGE06437.1 MAG: hypothetical protein A2W70_01055 [Candidatus Curtissbacteria bacterium RIFCSPLOWO2_02_41_11]